MSAAKEIVILGARGNCIDILDAIEEINRLRTTPELKCIAFLDDDPSLQGTQIDGIPVRGPLETASEFRDAFFVAGIGSPATFHLKQSIVDRTRLPTERFVSVVHPRAVVSRRSTLGSGAVVLPHATVASGVRIADHVMILPHVVVNHDCEIGRFTILASGASISGGVRVGQSCYIGTHASIRGNLRVGNGALIGMGSVVLEDVPDFGVYVGNPARLLRWQPGKDC